MGEVEAVTINYGLFILAVVDFLIVVLMIFMTIKAMNAVQKKPYAG